MSKTDENLKKAFAGESQANRRYLAFAKKSEGEGFKQIAKLFRAAADAETVHAMNHLRVMKGVRITKDNLQEAISGDAASRTVLTAKRTILTVLHRCHFLPVIFFAGTVGVESN